MNIRTFRRTARKLPYQLATALSIALAISFAAGAASVAAYPTAEEAAYRDALPPISMSPFEYYPGKYQNQATEVEPLPPTF
jgi:hypothetical protein